jgi:uncharacterized damage-inducible protein DinB
MMNKPLQEMFRYNRWANLTLLEACRNLNETQLRARPSGVSGTVAELLIHIVGAQQTFVLRTKGRQHEGEMSRSTPWPGINILIEVAESSSNDLIEIAGGLDLDGEVNLHHGGKDYRFPMSFFLVHALEHGVEHRTEVKVALGTMGIKTPDLDGWTYATSAGYGREV